MPPLSWPSGSRITEDEFAHILTAFPIVAEDVKIATLAAFRDVAARP
jgi:hypothetical protein